MITQVYPKDFQRFLALPVLGPLIDAYAAWLHEHQYTRRSSRYELRMAARVSEFLQGEGFRKIEDIRQSDLQTCYQWFRRRFPKEEGSVRVLEKFLVEKALVCAQSASEPSHEDALLNRYMAHLRDDHGYVAATIQRQCCIVAEFLGEINFREQPYRLAQVSMADIEGFIRHLAKRMGRVALQKPIAVIRHFLRFLATRGVIRHGLDSQIDTPRVYRQENLPRALPWTTVEAFLHSIDRNTFTGKRDYAMFSLMATYGLRACDVVALKLDDIKWRFGCIRICQTKTGNPLELPLTHEVSSALYDYLKGVPRYGQYRQVFLRLRAPGGTLKPTAVTEAFQAWSRKSGLDIPFQGTYCLRHSYALHLFHHGLPLKTIGDLLGHRSPESTAVYIRLVTEDLREVPLHVPVLTEGQGEVAS